MQPDQAAALRAEIDKSEHQRSAMREMVRRRKRAVEERSRAAAYVGPPDGHAIGAIIGECDWWTEIQLLNDEEREGERLG